jgi:SAM-dependent methyltransferase
MENKIILDACCGSRMMWFDKVNKYVIYGDNRNEEHVLCDNRTLLIRPDVELDFTKLTYEDETFYHVVFDPPHMVKLGKNSWMAKKYGVLGYHWRDDIRDGINECMRVLKPFGTLNFKWNENQVPEAEIRRIIDYGPLYGFRSGKAGKTIWMTFVKGVSYKKKESDGKP